MVDSLSRQRDILLLDSLTALRRVSELSQRPLETVFADWLEVLDWLLRLPQQDLAQLGSAPDSLLKLAPVAELEDLLLPYLPESCLQHLCASAAQLLRFTSLGYADPLGTLWQMLFQPPYTAPCFLPWAEAYALARQNLLTSPCLTERLREAYREASAQLTPLERLQTVRSLTSLLVTPRDESPLTLSQFVAQIWPQLEAYFEPIQHFLPYLGSGSLLLAYAAQYPRWTLDLGLVRLGGVEHKPAYLRLVRLNCRLYGLSDRHLHQPLDLAPEYLSAYPGSAWPLYAQYGRVSQQQQAQIEAQLESQRFHYLGQGRVADG